MVLELSFQLQRSQQIEKLNNYSQYTEILNNGVAHKVIACSLNNITTGGLTSLAPCYASPDYTDYLHP